MAARISKYRHAAGELLWWLLGELLKHDIPSGKQVAHVALKEEDVGDPTEQAQGRSVVKNIPHQRAPAGDSLEEMVVLKAPERSADHDVAEMIRAVHHRDSAGEPLDKAEVDGLPSNHFAFLDEPRGSPRDRPLLVLGLADLMDVDVAGQVEDQLNRRGYLDAELNPRHGTIADASEPALRVWLGRVAR